MTNTLALENTTIELTMDELNQIIGGEDEIMISGSLKSKILDKAIDAVVKSIGKLFAKTLPDTFEQFYKEYKEHQTALDISIGVIITAACGPVGTVLYAKCDKKDFMRKVYNRFKGL